MFSPIVNFGFGATAGYAGSRYRRSDPRQALAAIGCRAPKADIRSTKTAWTATGY
jgi:hypothetical protein